MPRGWLAALGRGGINFIVTAIVLQAEPRRHLLIRRLRLQCQGIGGGKIVGIDNIVAGGSKVVLIVLHDKP